MKRSLREKLPLGKFEDVPEAHSRRMRAIKAAGSRSTEQVLITAMVQANLGGWEERPKDIKGKPDLFFRELNVAVFVDGCFWHGCPQCGHIPGKNRPYWEAKIGGNRERDRETVGLLEAEGKRVVRLWEHELKQDLSGCVTQIREATGPVWHVATPKAD